MEKAAFAFRTEGTPVEFRTLGHGHINKTMLVTTDAGREYVLQKINTYVFKDPVGLMNNAGSVTDFIRRKEKDPQLSLRYINTHDGAFCHEDHHGSFWRMYNYMDGFCLDMPESEADLYESALAFGRFQELLSDYPADTLCETIPNFHNTPDRYRQFKESVAADAAGRLADVREEVAFILAREEQGSRLQKMLEAGELPLRVTHNDTKLNNVLLDKDTRKCKCVLDLDTVMPGLSAFDFGDSIRFGAATALEDEKDLSKMELDLHLFEVYTRGFLKAASALTEREIQVLPMGAYTMTLEVGLRFLKDYLDGDVYFGTAYPEHNLVRARTQIKLLADMEGKMADMERIVAQVAGELRK